MSDIAPFVAAALRDKVVRDLQEENKKLRETVEELEQQKKTGTKQALIEMYSKYSGEIVIAGHKGLHRDVYAYCGDYTDFETIKTCTLRDLPKLLIFEQGLGPFPFSLCGDVAVDMECYDQTPTTWEEFFPPDGYCRFNIFVEFQDILLIEFDLPSIPKERYFEIIDRNFSEFLANPKTFFCRGPISADKLIALFGADTEVIFVRLSHVD